MYVLKCKKKIMAKGSRQTLSSKDKTGHWADYTNYQILQAEAAS